MNCLRLAVSLIVVVSFVGTATAKPRKSSRRSAVHIIKTYKQQHRAIRALVDQSLSLRAEELYREANSAMGKAHLLLYLKEYRRATKTAKKAQKLLKRAARIAQEDQWTKRELDLSLIDLHETMTRARVAASRAGIDPLVASALAVAESESEKVRNLALVGRDQEAHWRADDARMLAIITIEHAQRLAPPRTLISGSSIFATRTVPKTAGSGGDVTP